MNFFGYKILYTECCTCLSVILLDSIFVDSDNEQYPQIFLEDFKCAIKKGNKCNYNEELKLDESDDEYNDDPDKLDEYQHTYDGLH